MFKWLRWLLGEDDDKKAKPITESVKKKESKSDVKGFVDPETGKGYKTAGSLKAAQTRRRNKAKKKAKK